MNAKIIKSKKSRILLIISLIIFALAGSFTWYVSDYYRADTYAKDILVSNTNVLERDFYIEITPQNENENNIGFIFYPGGKVEYTSYLPILSKLSEEANMTIFLVKMPFNLAVFNQDAAKNIMLKYPDIKTWYIGGHSLGGAMSSSYASNNPDQFKGLILLGAYLYGDFPVEKTLTIYGTLNTNVAENVDYNNNVVIIEGGNHAQFGNYGKQKGDPDALISAEEQQDIAVEAITQFIEGQ